MASQPVSIISALQVPLLKTMALTTPGGHPIVEVGVFNGGSAWYLAEAARIKGDELHLFDTFSGIPFHDPNDSNVTGEFPGSYESVLEAIPDAHFHVGIFPETMPTDLKSVSFVHCDCDQYRSVRPVIDIFWPLLVPGGVMAFDDMFTAGGRRAILETFPDIGGEQGWWLVGKPSN